MEQRIYHGVISPSNFSQNLISHFNRGNLRVQQIGDGDKLAVQIATKEWVSSGGQTALSVSFQKVEDGVSVQVGKQAWLGVAASLGFTVIAALQNPFSLLNRIDDLAQDVEYLQLVQEVWNTLDQTASALGANHMLSERLRRAVCDYCATANPVGEPRCIACGAPLGEIQPSTCRSCGYVLIHGEKICPNCKRLV
jgi:hypothetical protein